MKEELLSFSNNESWRKSDDSERVQTLNDAVKSLIKYKYVGDFSERLLKHMGFASDCRNFTDKGKAYAKEIGLTI